LESAVKDQKEQNSKLIEFIENMKTDVKVLLSKQQSHELREQSAKKHYESTCLNYSNEIKFLKDNEEILTIRLNGLESDYNILEERFKSNLEKQREDANLISCLRDENHLFKEKHSELLKKLDEMNSSMSVKEMDWINAKERYYKEMMKVLSRESRQLDTITDLANRMNLTNREVESAKYSDYQSEQRLAHLKQRIVELEDALKLSNEKTKQQKLTIESLHSEIAEREAIYLAEFKTKLDKEQSLLAQVQGLQEELNESELRNEHHLKIIVGMRAPDEPFVYTRVVNNREPVNLVQENINEMITKYEEDLTELRILKTKLYKQLEDLKRENYKLNRRVKQSEDLLDAEGKVVRADATGVLKELDDEWFRRFMALEEEVNDLRSRKPATVEVYVKGPKELSNLPSSFAVADPRIKEANQWMCEKLRQYGVKIPDDYKSALIADNEEAARKLKDINECMRNWLRKRAISFQLPMLPPDCLSQYVEELYILHQKLYENVGITQTSRERSFDDEAQTETLRKMYDFYEKEYAKVIQMNKILIAKNEELAYEKGVNDQLKFNEPKWSFERKELLDKLGNLEEEKKVIEEKLDQALIETSVKREDAINFVEFKTVLSDVVKLPSSLTTFSNEFAIFIRRHINALCESNKLLERDVQGLTSANATLQESLRLTNDSNRTLSEEIVRLKMHLTVPEAFVPTPADEPKATNLAKVERELLHYKEKDKLNEYEKSHFTSEIFHLTNDRRVLLRKIQELQTKAYELQESVSFYQIETSKLSDMDVQLDELQTIKGKLETKISVQNEKISSWLIDLRALLDSIGVKYDNEADMEEITSILSNQISILSVRITRLEKERSLWYDDYSRQKEANALLIRELSDIRIRHANK
jgi:hypothetical protein